MHTKKQTIIKLHYLPIYSDFTGLKIDTLFCNIVIPVIENAVMLSSIYLRQTSIWSGLTLFGPISKNFWIEVAFSTGTVTL